MFSFAQNLHRAQVLPTGDGTLAPQDSSDEVRPPIPLLAHRPILFERRPRPLVDRLSASPRFVARDPIALQHPPSDLRVQYFVGPIVVVEVR